MWVIIPLLRWDCWEETWDPKSLWSVQTQKLTKLMIWASKVKSFRNNWKERLVMMTPGHHCTAWSDLAISPCRSSQRGRVLCPGWKVTTHYARRRHLYPAQSQRVCVCARARAPVLAGLDLSLPLPEPQIPHSYKGGGASDKFWGCVQLSHPKHSGNQEINFEPSVEGKIKLRDPYSLTW